MAKPRSLTEDEVKSIHADRRSYRIIAKDYDISAMTVAHIKAGKTHKYLGLRPTARHIDWETYEKGQTRPCRCNCHRVRPQEDGTGSNG